MPMRFPVQTKGYALIEILLAFGIAVIVIVAMVSLAVVTVRAATTSKAYAEAGKVAQSQAERLKLLRDTTPWSTFLPSMLACSGYHCNIDSSRIVRSGDTSVGTGPSAVTSYFTTNVVNIDSKEFTYTVVASWNISNVTKTYTIEGLLSDWRSI